MKNQNIQLKFSMGAVTKNLRKARPYVGVMLFLVLAGIYGYLILQINTLSNPAIDTNTVLTEAKSTPVPRIDGEAAKQLLELKDNSVSVQTLFEQSRNNPFNE